MNKTIKLLMFSDIFIVTGFGLIDPILAIFVKEDIAGGTIFAAGLASMLFLLTKCVVQLPFSRYVDSHDDRVKWLVIGSIIATAAPIIYIFSTNIHHIYAAQVILGIGSGLAYPTWLSLWSTNLDRHHESFEWSVYSTATGIGTAFTAAVGAAIAQFAGFNTTFALVAVMSLIGAGILFKLEKEQDKGKIKTTHYHKTRQIKGMH